MFILKAALEIYKLNSFNVTYWKYGVYAKMFLEAKDIVAKQSQTKESITRINELCGTMIYIKKLE